MYLYPPQPNIFFSLFSFLFLGFQAFQKESSEKIVISFRDIYGFGLHLKRCKALHLIVREGGPIAYIIHTFPQFYSFKLYVAVEIYKFV